MSDGGEVVHLVDYDEVPYESVPATGSHPARLAATAAVMGCTPPPIQRCRVLEIGCGVGANTLPIAADLPDAEVVGIDLSGRQIELARTAARELGLTNVSFLQLDILDVGVDLGQFDYVIAHGIYSWVPAPVRDRVLAICDAQLTDHGLAYVSYNTLPGWHHLAVLRDLLRHHVRRAPSAAARLAGVGEVFGLLTDGITARSDGMARHLRELAVGYAAMLDGLGRNREAALHHDILAEINDPMYVRDVIAHAGRHHLAYVAEAGLWYGLGLGVPREVHDRLTAMTSDPAELAQYIDFLTMRTLRQSVLCRATAPIAAAPSPDKLAGLWVGGALRPVSAHPELHGDRPERFTTTSGAVLTSNQPVTKAALVHLVEQTPALIEFDQLVAAAHRRLGWPEVPPGTRPAGHLDLARLLLLAATSDRGSVTLATLAPSLAREPGARPLGRALARWQLRTTSMVTNHLHEPVVLTPFQVATLERCDGSRDRGAILDELVGLAAAGSLTVTRNGKPVPGHQVRSVLARDLDVTLGQLAGQALLTA